MQLTHEKATKEELSTYLQAMCHPVPVMTLYGCCAKLEEKKKRAGDTHKSTNAVYYGWVDAICNWLQNSVFPEDTMFLIFEEDWRLKRSHTVVERLLAEAASVAAPPAEEPEPALTARRSRSRSPRRPWRAAGRPEPSAGGTRLSAPQGDVQTEQIPRWLRDTVEFMNVAKKQGRGDVVWLSWSCGTGKYTQGQPAHGSHAVGVTSEGAHAFQAALVRQYPWHLDCLLRRWCRNEVECHAQGVAPNSWLYPSLGNFGEHVSGCDDAVGHRNATWDAPHVAEGTRPQEDRQNRLHELRVWTKGSRGTTWKKLCHVQGPSATTSPWWRTFHPEALTRNTEMDNGDKNQRQLVAGCGWLQEQRSVVVGTKGLKSAPQAVRTAQNGPYDYQPDGAATTARQARNRRKVGMQYYNYRVFTNSQASSWPHHSAATQQHAKVRQSSRSTCREQAELQLPGNRSLYEPSA